MSLNIKLLDEVQVCRTCLSRDKPGGGQFNDHEREGGGIVAVIITILQ